MSQVIFFVLFLLMIPAALMSVAFASRHWFAIIWNGFWYLIFNEVAVRAFDSPQAKYIGYVLMFCYLIKALSRPQPSIRFQMHNLRSYRPTPRAAHTEREREVREEFHPTLGEKVIEAEYRRL